MNVSERFLALLENIALTDPQQADGIAKHHGVRRCLNSHYWNQNSDSNNSMLVGSWGKSTEIRPPRDVDVLFELPRDVYDRYQNRPGNKQSQLLQEVKRVLAASYPNTELSGDGQVVVVRFSTCAVEVVPAFELTTGQYYICDTNANGRYKAIDPKAEIQHVSTSNSLSNGNTRHLIRMAKCWQGFCNVPLKSFHIELLTIKFLETWSYRGNSAMWYDWMVRDFFRYLQRNKNTYIFVPGTSEILSVGDAWASRVDTAEQRATKACEHESKNEGIEAGVMWRYLFDEYIPVY